MSGIMATYFDHPGERNLRLVGRQKKSDSGYFDIVRFFGNGCVAPGEVSIEYVSHQFQFCDPMIAEFSRQMEKVLTLEGRLFSGPAAAKLVGFAPEEAPMKMTVQKCRYGDQAGSCFALDHVHPLFDGWGGTLRDYYLTEYTSRRPADNPLAICLGVCAYLLAEEMGSRYLLGVRRSGGLASLENSWGPSTAGSIDYSCRFTDLVDVIGKSLSSEATEELGLSRADYDIIPLAYAREIFRGERPQLFSLMRTRLSRLEIISRLENIEPCNREFDRFQFIELSRQNGLETADFERLNHEARMNYYLLEEYLSEAD